MLDWWHALDGFTRVMYGAAIFFGVIFVYEMLAAFTGIGGDSDAESSPAHDAAADDAQQASHSTAVFKMFSVRSIVSFFTLFCWGTALYASSGKTHSTALALGTAWGVAAMVVVSAVVHFMRGLAYDPKARLKDSVGSEVTVHFDIPPGGEGEVRLLFGGAITHCRAREARGNATPAGSRARVTRVLGPNLVEVERL
jgi:hypothetical protein